MPYSLMPSTTVFNDDDDERNFNSNVSNKETTEQRWSGAQHTVE